MFEMYIFVSLSNRVTVCAVTQNDVMKMEAGYVDTSVGRRAGLIYCMLALVTVSVWGVTFVSTKVLISYGMTPTWIFMMRFIIAYMCVIAFNHSRLWADSLRDELYMVAMGLTGGSLYYISENTALEMTFASDVSLIICAIPMLTMVLGLVVYRDRIRIRAVIGSIIALCGVAAVILNGSLNLGLDPVGDLLALLAAFFWAVYCLLLKLVNRRYSNMFITRKLFFYGCVSALFFCAFEPLPEMPSGDAVVPVVFNLLFLGVIASFVCYIVWSMVIKAMGPEKTANYLYVTPLITIVTSSLVLGEPVTVWMIAGGAAIMAGVFLTETS